MLVVWLVMINWFAMVGAGSDGGMVGSSKTSFQWLELVVMVM